MYDSRKSARKAAEATNKKYGVQLDRKFSYYKCFYCKDYHVGKNSINRLYNNMGSTVSTEVYK